ncbi:RNA 2',3'-cyclic phosphodiesterase [Alkalimarinus coralli]|uniref:RNA 2',3'-cyclic phosphodiesterase n=1 Tax=Alkalimarinus coralli TaxID=2935863 RepID=UPI00202B3A91|nr:RNA 2',3'-cyclic phosphodiesterase [Alkalimarinus coralli]
MNVNKATQYRRCFIGFSIPEPLKSQLIDAQKALKKQPLFQHFRWVPPQNLHITLHFLGNIKPNELAALHSELSCHRLINKPIPISIGSISGFPQHFQGAFTSRSAPFLVANINNHQPLQAFYTTLAQHLAELNLTIETRTYRPHITLARTGKKRNLHRNDRVALPQFSFEQHANVSGYTLFESTPGGQHPVYKPIGEYQ